MVGPTGGPAASGAGVAVAQPARAVERLAVERRAVATVEVGRHQHTAAGLDLEVVPGDRLIVDADIRLRIAPNGRPPRDRHRPRLPALAGNPYARIHPQRA